MYQVIIKPHWEISRDGAVPLDTTVLLKLLLLVQKTGSIAQAAQAIGLSYRYAWGLLREAEKLFGSALINSERGRGTDLTPIAQTLIWADRRIVARLSPLLESLASELESELIKTTAKNSKAIRLDASHGFAVATLLKHINMAKVPIELRYRNSTDAIAALVRQECDLAGFHVPLGKFERATVAHYARWLNPQKHCLLHLAVRDIGLFVAPGNPKDIHDLHDLVRSDVHFVNRQSGSGTRMMLELMLAKLSISTNDINGFESAELTHAAVAAYIASGMGDVGIGVRTAGQHFGLEFIPLLRERYFFALPFALLDDPLIRQVIGLLLSPSFRADVDALAGYDATDTGKIQSLADAFDNVGKIAKRAVIPAKP
jgi:molybdate transport repressor ModE-like protein